MVHQYDLPHIFFTSRCLRVLLFFVLHDLHGSKRFFERVLFFTFVLVLSPFFSCFLQVVDDRKSYVTKWAAIKREKHGKEQHLNNYCPFFSLRFWKRDKNETDLVKYGIKMENVTLCNWCTESISSWKLQFRPILEILLKSMVARGWVI